MYQSPRIRRLHSDLAAMERIRSESSVFRFTSTGDPPQQYNIILAGKSLWRDRGKVRTLEQHRVEIKLGASYPRTIPEIRWLTPIFHPNISEIGMVCLGGYGTHWVPSVQLDDLCVMLWDMARYYNYDIRSPYNRESALWVAGQTNFRFPIDPRPLRDLRASLGRSDTRGDSGLKDDTSSRSGRGRSPNAAGSTSPNATPVSRVLQFIERYGRGSNDSAQRVAERPNFAEAMARIAAERSREGRSSERSSVPGSNADAPQPLPNPPEPACNEASGVKAETLVADREPAVTAVPEPNHSRFVDDRNDVLILEAAPDAAPNEPARSGDDEIMFIS